MSTKPKHPTLDDESIRNQFKTRVRSLRGHVAAGHVAESADALAALDDWYRPIAESALSCLLLQTLAWEDEDYKLCERLQASATTVADLARQAALLAASGLDVEDPRAADAIARAILAWARACKLEHLAHVPSPRRQRFRDLHSLLEAAERRQSTGATRHCTCDGQAMEASIESLYVRALLLARLMGGNLTAQQVEILDNWLLQWMPSMWISAEPADVETALVVRLAGNAGLVQEAIAVADDVRYVCVAPLQSRLQQAIASLQQGDLFPGWGLATALRVEDHVVVLDSLQRELAQIAAGDYTRRPGRAQAFGMAVDTHVGVNPVIAGMFDEPSRPIRMRLQDHNETGVGFLADAIDADRVHAGDLIAMRLYPDQPMVIGEVVRKRAGRADEDIAVGVRLLARETVPLTLEFEAEGRGARPVRSLYIPGLDRSGRHDAIAVPEGAFKAGKVIKVEDEGEILRMSLNRVRHKGRGWVVAGFEMIVDTADDEAIDAPVTIAAPPPKASGAALSLELVDFPEGNVR